MSFALTTQQILDEVKDVTRRVGWEHLRPGDRLCAIRQGQGLPAGTRVERLKVLAVLDVRREQLHLLTDDIEYGLVECQREGFGAHASLRFPSMFVPWFCSTHRIGPFYSGTRLVARARRCEPHDFVTRIEFKYVKED